MEIRKLVLKFLLFSILITSTYYFAMWQLSHGQIDYFYNKFTYKAESIIIGSSRADDGITPNVIEQNFDKDMIDYPILNFAFAHQISDFGPVYMNAIKQKLDRKTKKGLFIIEVNPASLSILRTKPDKITSIKEDDTFLSKMHDFNEHPNFEYIRKLYNHPLYKCFQKSRRIDIIRYSHIDGWQEVMRKCETYEVSEADVLRWTSQKLNEYDKMKGNFTPSQARILSLEQIIKFFQKYGQVFLVRTPIDLEFLNLETSYWPEFNTKLKDIACNNHIAYLNYSMDGKFYRTYDGSHLFGDDAKMFTKKLCDDIKYYRTNLH